jgi:hypothetical protein
MPIATNDQSNIYHFKKQTMEKLTSQARILTISRFFILIGTKDITDLYSSVLKPRKILGTQEYSPLYSSVNR